MSTAETSQMVCRNMGSESSSEDIVCRAASSLLSWSSSFAWEPAASCIRFIAKAVLATLDIACMRTCAAWALSRQDAHCVSSVKLPRRVARYCSAALSYTPPIVRSSRPPKETCASSHASCEMDVMKPASSRPTTHWSSRSQRFTAHFTSRTCCCSFIFWSFLESPVRRISRSSESPSTSCGGALPSSLSVFWRRSRSRCKPFAMWSVCIAR
mmetsp:Transcript_13468/g.38300  ORF Transcript_13468/g.38300 Transcript_13468/m.38300 type:complete len:212 (-) Transcript_13468:894-1529(-)